MRALIIAACFAALAWSQTRTADELFRSAVNAQQRGDLAIAVRDYQEAIRLRPDLFDAHANLAVALVHLGRFEEAVSAYRAALKLDPSDRTVRTNLALAFYKAGDFRKAAAEFEILRQGDAADARVATLLADCYLRLGDKARAIATVAPLEGTHPDDLDLAFVLGSALIASGKERDGLVRIERFAKQRNTAEAYFLAGKTRLRLDEYPEAAADLDQAVRLNPNLPGVYTLRGVALEGAGNEQGAEADLRKALEANANDFEANVHLGGILYLRRDLPESKKYLDRALQLEPSSAFARYQMALWKSASGQLNEAVTDLEAVVKRDPNWLQAHVELAALYYRLHRPEDGMKERQIVDRLSADQQATKPRLLSQP